MANTNTKTLKNELNEKLKTIESATENFSKLMEMVQQVGNSINQVKEEVCSIQSQIVEAEAEEKRLAELEAEKLETQRIIEEKVKEYNIHEDVTVLEYFKDIFAYFTDEEIVLQANGVWTKCTQTRMNEFSDTYDLGYRVKREKVGTPKEQWFVEYEEKKLPFNQDKLVLKRPKVEV